MISYLVTVCTELEELVRLVTFLSEHKRTVDEIVILQDCGASRRVWEQLVAWELSGIIAQFTTGNLQGDFAQFKNAGNQLLCQGDVIFQLDADEMPTAKLMRQIAAIECQEWDLIKVPRINTVEGLTQQHIDKWGWNVNPSGWINFPDYQDRIYRNNPKIKWVGKVHEHIEGHQHFAVLPAHQDFCLQHHKSISKQEQQNKLYDDIVS